MTKNVIWLDQLGLNDLEQVGGKNASLGEMISQLSQSEIAVPGGFATTAKAFHSFLEQNQLTYLPPCSTRKFGSSGVPRER